MIFGKKVPATINRLDATTSTWSQVLPSTSFPTFTVRRFMGTTLQTLRPEVNVTQPFGIDINQLRLIFADWPDGLDDDFPVLPSDTITVNNRNYVVIGGKFFPGSHMEIYIRTPVGSTDTQ